MHRLPITLIEEYDTNRRRAKAKKAKQKRKEANLGAKKKTKKANATMRVKPQNRSPSELNTVPLPAQEYHAPEEEEEADVRQKRVEGAGCP